MTTDITELAPLKPGKYAILYRDNWDGEKNEYHTLAVLTEEGGWYDDEFNAELLKYQGDKILKVWPLDDGSNVIALVEALEKAQAKATQQGNIACALLDEVTQLRRDADEKAPELRAQLIEADSELESLRQRIAELESSGIAPGILRCTECSFVLTKNIISVTADTITTDESEPEPCPNGCGQLQPVTWKALAIQLMFTTKQGVSDLLEAKKLIAELESRTVTVKFTPIPVEELGNLSDGKKHPYMFGAGYNSAVIHCESVILQELAAKGIKVRVE